MRQLGGDGANTSLAVTAFGGDMPIFERPLGNVSYLAPCRASRASPYICSGVSLSAGSHARAHVEESGSLAFLNLSMVRTGNNSSCAICHQWQTAKRSDFWQRTSSSSSQCSEPHRLATSHPSPRTGNHNVMTNSNFSPYYVRTYDETDRQFDFR